MTGTASPNVYTIPPGIGFAEVFAARLLQDYTDRLDALPKLLVLLPTRRSCRIMREAFLRQSGGAALLLPRLQTLGDIDEDALGLEMAALGEIGARGFEIPPALPTLRRKIILTRLILARADPQSPDQALLLADALGRLLDRIYTEDLHLGDLPGLVDAERFSEHWQMTLRFLTIISAAWPEILADLGLIDAADRRNRLLKALADHWQAHPPPYPIIAAGSTGSIPAVGHLLNIISRLPQGSVVLPGLDQTLNERSWRALEDSHPQMTLKALLQRMAIDRSAVKLWTEQISPRCPLATAVMRPAETSDLWRDLKKNAASFGKMLHSLQRVDCSNAQEEARLIALIFRHIQHQTGQTAALVTFDRNLARRVAACCTRWGLKIDDSGGEPLAHTPAGRFFALCVNVCIEDLAPIPLLALLKHQRLAAKNLAGDVRGMIRYLDQDILRGPRPVPGFAGLRDRVPGDRAPDLTEFLDALEKCLAPLFALCDDRAWPFSDFLDAHIQVAECLAGTADILWQGEDGEAMALFLSDLRGQAGDMPDIRAADYLPMLQTLMQGVMVRPAWGTHPRLSILGPLEARLLSADVVILGGLNEGSWPPEAENDPWMSRPMRADFGLPAPERGIGLSAHDFVQGFCSSTVILTRAERAGTAPTIPSRWLQRLDAVVQAAGLTLPRTDWMEKSRFLDQPAQVQPTHRPGPRPPADKRPAQLSITDIETWMRDPYALYARHILNLRVLDPIDQLPGPADQGTLIHAALERFTRQYPDALPDDALDLLRGTVFDLLETQISDHRTRHFWRIRFDRAAGWLIPHERDWRAQARLHQAEIRGRLHLPEHAFHLTAKADRIDRLRDGSGVAVIDYKTGAAPSKKDILAGLSPQLPLEAAMILGEGFIDVRDRNIAYLGHWILSGRQGGKAEEIKAPPHDLAQAALTGLQNLIAVFANENTPYYSIPRPAARPRYSDYTHLARVQEWAVLDDGDTVEDVA